MDEALMTQAVVLIAILSVCMMAIGYIIRDFVALWEYAREEVRRLKDE